MHPTHETFQESIGGEYTVFRIDNQPDRCNQRLCLIAPIIQAIMDSNLLLPWARRKQYS